MQVLPSSAGDVIKCKNLGEERLWIMDFEQSNREKKPKNTNIVIINNGRNQVWN